MADFSTIQIHQTVHGYRDGHELLGSSISLNSSTRRTILALSDLSGDGSPRGFEEYLTAYPLREAGFYAFARTWQAGEMSRPGCVWTHTLLIAFQDVGSLGDLGSLRSYFRRPETGRTSTLLPAIQHKSGPNCNIMSQPDGAAYEIIARLYGQDRPVLIFGESAIQYEDTAIAIWNQQWGSLRCAFGFCTGALEPRSVEKRPLDLQIVPQQRQRRTARFAEKYSVISSEDIARSGELAMRSSDAFGKFELRDITSSDRLCAFGEGNPDQCQELGVASTNNGVTFLWQNVLIRDLIRPDRSLHEFVETYCVDVPPHREAFRNIIECWMLIETLGVEGLSVQNLTQVLAKAFPESCEAKKLKIAVLGQHGILKWAKEDDIVHELLTTPDVKAFDYAEIDVTARAQRLFLDGMQWRTSEITWLLDEDCLNETGRWWSQTVLEKLTIEDICSIFSENQTLFSRLVLERPLLATEKSLWRQPRELQRAAVKVLKQISDEQSIQDIFSSIVAANAYGIMGTLMEELGPIVIHRVLTAIDLNHRSFGDINEWQWASQLRGNGAEILEWLGAVERPLPWTLAFAVGLLGPSNSALFCAPNMAFVSHLNTENMDSSDIESVDFAAFCLAIGLRNFNGNAGPVTVKAFALVHDAAMHARVSRRAWQWLGPVLPRPGWLALENWDDGEKLRRALVEAFLRYRWDAPLLLEAFGDLQTRHRIVNYCAAFSSGRELLREAGL